MNELILIFLAQFAMIFGLGFQQMNVTGRHYIAAAITSFMLGIFGFHITAVIAEAGVHGMFTDKWWAYIIAGPIAICCAIFIHPKLKAFMNGRS